LEPKRVRDAPRGHARGAANPEVTLVLGRYLREAGGVISVEDADEHAGLTAVERGGDDAGALERLPRRLQEQPLLRVDGHRLARADAEEGRIELGGVV